MLDQNQDIEFSDHDLEVIEEALLPKKKSFRSKAVQVVMGPRRD